MQPNADWWVPHYPADNMKRPTGPLCDGCHSVNYNVRTKTVTEWNVGCEKCHGPGSEHVKQTGARHYRQPGAVEHDEGHRHLHPVSLTGQTPDQSRRGRVLRLAGRAFTPGWI